ncbi:MAG TPA: SDR family oxidoreductase [Pirellulaceae bacterium]|nr:SDR family oxidoreductase [Pirellulaceae bacterium]
MTRLRAIDLERTAIVTGAGGGMGRATVARLLRDGWSVVGVDHYSTGVPENDAATRFLPADVRDPELPALVRRATDGLPPVAGLVNLVGASIGDRLAQLTDEDWQTSFDINVTPAMRLMRDRHAELAAMRGSIVNVGSPVGTIGARKPSYAASKAALVGLTMSAARNLGPDVRVNLLLPGPTITGMTADWDDERRRHIADGSFLRRFCLPDEIAAVIAFLLGPDSSAMSGSIVDLTAGTMFGH